MSIILDANNKSLQLVLGGAVATNQIPFVSSFITYLLGVPSLTPTEQDGLSNSTTAVTMVTAPASGQILVKNIAIQNIDTASVTATILYNNNATLRKIFTAILPVNYCLGYEDGSGWSVYNTNGARLSAAT
jgi:hypothetical protein